MAWKFREHESPAYRCCFCCHVRTGTLIIGLLTLLSQGVVLSSFIVALMHPEMLHNSPVSDTVMLENGHYVSGAVTVDPETLAMGIAVTSILMMITSCLIYGCIRGNHHFLVPFVAFQIFDACVTGLAMIGHFTNAAAVRDWIRQQNWGVYNKSMLLNMDDNHLMLWVSFMFIVSMLLQMYLISVVWACYIYLKERNAAQGSTGRRYYELDMTNGDAELLLPPKYEDIAMMPAAPLSANMPVPPPAYTDN